MNQPSKKTDPARSSSERAYPHDSAFLMSLTCQFKENDRFHGVAVFARNTDPDAVNSTKTVGDAVRWLNRELRTARDLVTGAESILPDSVKYPRVVTDAENPRLRKIPSNVMRLSEMNRYAKTLIKHGAVHKHDVADLVPFVQYVANLKRNADGTFVQVAEKL